MLCLNKEALKDKYVILDGTTPLWDKKNKEPLYNADEPALLVRAGEIVLYYGQALRVEPMDGCFDNNYFFFENCFKVESIRYFGERGTNAMTESYSSFYEYGNENFSATFMAPVHYVTDPEVYQAVSLDPFAGTDKSHPYPYHILVKHDEFDEDHTCEDYLCGMSAFIGFSLEAPEDKQVCLVREYEGRYTPRFISGDELLKECNFKYSSRLIDITDDEYMDLNAMEIEFIYVFVNTHLGRMYHISESEYKNLEKDYIYGNLSCEYTPDPHLYWYGRRCIRNARQWFCSRAEDMPETLVEGIHFIIDSDDDPAYENGQHSALWEKFDKVYQMVRSDNHDQ